ncbi:hypothetical protein EVAR_24410_1 [Eumeta japonica]|uniref:Uncharacterized protein n=1 Tax=Eumeta variegata TaxID=151549 RepID=A0A4C1VS40_EUMVA|nr:hypothetical protein EVAR_24410_1 [Eumeta japonica]
MSSAVPVTLIYLSVAGRRQFVRCAGLFFSNKLKPATAPSLSKLFSTYKREEADSGPECRADRRDTRRPPGQSARVLGPFDCSDSERRIILHRFSVGLVTAAHGQWAYLLMTPMLVCLSKIL